MGRAHGGELLVRTVERLYPVAGRDGVNEIAGVVGGRHDEIEVAQPHGDVPFLGHPPHRTGCAGERVGVGGRRQSVEERTVGATSSSQAQRLAGQRNPGRVCPIHHAVGEQGRRGGMLDAVRIRRGQLFDLSEAVHPAGDIDAGSGSQLDALHQ
jgi:hypothetical protein